MIILIALGAISLPVTVDGRRGPVASADAIVDEAAPVGPGIKEVIDIDVTGAEAFTALRHVNRGIPPPLSAPQTVA